MAHLGSSDLEVHPLGLGGGVFGWTTDEEASFAGLLGAAGLELGRLTPEGEGAVA